MERTEQIGTLWTGLFIITVVCAFVIIHPAGAVTGVTGTASPVLVVPKESTVKVVDLNATGQAVRIGPSHVLYGLKISLEDLDVSFIRVPEKRVEKQMEYAQIRIAEVKTELANNRSTGAETALNRYKETMRAVTTTVSSVPPEGNTLLMAQETAAEQQAILSHLISTHEDSPGLLNAFTEGVELQTAFTGKTGQKIEGQVLPDNRIALQAVKVNGEPIPVRTGTEQITGVIPVPTGQPTPVITGKPTISPSHPPTTTPHTTPAPTPPPAQTIPTQAPVITQNTVTPTPTPTPVITQAPTPQPTKPPATTPPNTQTAGGKGGNTGSSGTGKGT